MTKIASPTIISGLPQSLNETLLGYQEKGGKAFIERFLLLNDDLIKHAPLHIAVHFIKSLDTPPEPYAKLHCHPSCDEIGLIVAPKDELEYEIILGENQHRIKSPATVYIPAGTYHRARAISGNGAYVCILFDSRGPDISNVSLR